MQLVSPSLEVEVCHPPCPCPSPYLVASGQGGRSQVVDVTNFYISPKLQQSSEHSAVVLLCCQVQCRPEVGSSSAVGLWEGGRLLAVASMWW